MGMEAQERDIQTFETEDGKVPFRLWLKALRDTKARAIIRTRINRLRVGNFGDYKSVGDGVFELRIMYGPGYRIYFGQEGEWVVILLCGGVKDTQADDISKAKEYWENYRSRDDV
jgi:putative addiction module killer protein